jgi:hypothetical protein
LTLHSIETRCSAPAARRGPGSRAQFPLASTNSPPARPLSRPVARSPMAHPPVRPGAASAHSPAGLPARRPARSLALSPARRRPAHSLIRPGAARAAHSPTRLPARPLSPPAGPPAQPLARPLVPHRQYRCHSLTASTAVTLSLFPRALPPRRSVGLATPDHPVVAAAQT